MSLHDDVLRCPIFKGGAIEVVALLEPFFSDIVAKDRWGNTAVHIAAAGCDYELLKLLARRANLDIEKVSVLRQEFIPRRACLFASITLDVLSECI